MGEGVNLVMHEKERGHSSSVRSFLDEETSHSSETHPALTQDWKWLTPFDMGSATLPTAMCKHRSNDNQ